MTALTEDGSTTLLHELPAPGQLVRVRGRRCVVRDVRPSSLPTHRARPHHRVTVTSLDDDGWGEEFAVVWEIEPGAHVVENALLPSPARGLDPPAHVDAFLDAVRWGAVASADAELLRAPFHAGIEIEDYQLEPLVRALHMPRVNLLVADDVGLGKTIEAGLVAQELVLRHRVRTVLVVCPSSLRVQWREQMRDRFGLDFRIVDAELLHELRRRRGLHVNPWTHHPRLITSVDFLKREYPLRLLRDTLPRPGEPVYPRRFDLLIVDEAHNVAPSGRGRFSVDSQRTQAIRTLAPHFEHRLFLSATPHDGDPASFTALLELLDDQRFQQGLPVDPLQLRAVMVRRLKTELPPRWDGAPRFPVRTVSALEVELPPQERQAHADLQAYAQALAGRQGDGTARTATEFVLKLLKKRMFSSPAAFASTLARHRESVSQGRAATPRGARPAASVLSRWIARTEEVGADTDVDTPLDEAVHASAPWFGEPTAEERALLDRLDRFARDAADRPDARARALLDFLRATVRTPDGKGWSDTRVIVFTEYRTTQNWLLTQLTAHGFGGGERIQLLHGGLDTDERERVKNAFLAHPDQAPVRILLATDAASEGIDLHRHCARVVHYEIPWNPNRLEQRNGRVDRHGQRESEVRIFHFVPRGWATEAPGRAVDPGSLEGDLEFLYRMARKVDQIREDLGKAGPVLAQQVEEAMLGRRRALDVTAAEPGFRETRRLLKLDRDLRRDLDRARRQLDDTRAHLHLSPEGLHAAVQLGLQLAGQPGLRPATLPGVWPDPSGARTACPVFHLPPLLGAWARCAEGLEHPHTRAVRPLTFDHDLARHRDDVVLAHVEHRLVRMCLQLLRAEAWSVPGAERLHRVTVRAAAGDLPGFRDPCVLAHARMVVLGADQSRLHEEILTAGIALQQGRAEPMPADAAAGVMALLAAGSHAVPHGLSSQLTARWPALETPVRAVLEKRATERFRRLQKDLASRGEQEARDLVAVLAELEQAIRRAVTDADASHAQLTLDFGDETDRELYARERQGLLARLDALPEESARESAAIRARYAGTGFRVFPLAVQFVVPAQLAQAAREAR